MNRIFPALCLLGLASCVIDEAHVSTELHKICTDEVPVIFTQDNPALLSATIAVEGVARTVDAEARASLGDFSLQPTTGADDLSFATELSIEIAAPTSTLPSVRIAELAPVGPEVPITASGDPAINLVDYLTAEELEIRISLEGTAPVSTMAASFQGCLDVDGVVVDDDER